MKSRKTGGVGAAYNRGMVAAIILAAGRSIRMGQPKPLLPYGDTPEQTFTAHLVETAKHSGFREIYVVGRPEDDRLRDEVGRCGATFIENPVADQGQLSSLQAALSELETRLGAELDAVMVMPADAPLISAAAITRLLAVARTSEAQILRATYAGQHGHPVMFKRPMFAELQAADPDVGARAVVRADPSRVQDVDAGDPGVTVDVDTPEDYRRHFGKGPPTSR